MLMYADLGASLDVLIVTLEALLHLSLLLLYCCFTAALLLLLDVLIVTLEALLHLSNRLKNRAVCLDAIE
jgi:hypothetical protein